MSVDEAEDPLDAIVGAALKAMADSGAPRARLGAFAASFREEVAEILGRKPPPAPAPDLLQLVTHAVRQALAEPGFAPANRSGWIQERMLAVAAATGSDADGGAAH